VLPLMMLVLSAPNVDAYGDALPRGAVARLGTVRFTASGFSSVVSPDRNKLVLVHHGAVECWDLKNGQKLFRTPLPRLPFEYSDTKVLSFADGGRIILAVSHQVLHHLDPTTGVVLKVLDLTPSVADPVNPIRHIAARDEWLYVSCHNWVMRVRWQTGECGPKVKFPSIGALSDDGRYVTSFGDKATQIYNIDAGTPAGPELPIPIVAGLPRTSADGRRVAALTDDGFAVYDAFNGQEICRHREVRPTDNVPNRYRKIHALGLDQNTIYILRNSQTLKRFDLRTRAFVGDIALDDGHAANYSSIHFDEIRQRIIVHGTSAPLRVYDADGRALHAGEGLHRETAVAVLPNGKTVVAVDDGNRLRRWSHPFPPADPGTVLDHYVKYFRLAAHDNEHFFSVDRLTIRRWRLDGKNGHFAELPGMKDSFGTVFPTQFQADLESGFLFAVGSEGMQVWKPNGEPAWKVETDNRQPWSLRIIRLIDGHSICVERSQRDSSQHEIESGSVIVRYPTADERRYAFYTFRNSCFFPKYNLRLNYAGRMFRALSITGAHAFESWEFPETSGYSNTISEAAFSPDSHLVAAGLNDGRVFVIDRRSGAMLLDFAGHAGPVRGLTFSADYRQLISQADDGTILVWTLRPGYQHLAGPDGLAGLMASDPLVAYAGGWQLADEFPKYAAELRRRFPPVPLRDAAKELQLILTNLDAPQFAVRELAQKQLRDFADELPGQRRALEAAEKATASAEVRAKLNAVLSLPLHEASAGVLVRDRAVAAASRSDSPEAQALLKDWAAGQPDATLTLAAKAALRK
jgi:WD40 repeat protein